MKIFFSLFLIITLFACNTNPDPEEQKAKLKSSMADFLFKSNKSDSSIFKFRVEDVIYYDNKVNYICEFKVLMIKNGVKDSLGSMKAFISKDFSTVTRTY